MPTKRLPPRRNPAMPTKRLPRRAYATRPEESMQPPPAIAGCAGSKPGPPCRAMQRNSNQPTRSTYDHA